MYAKAANRFPVHCAWCHWYGSIDFQFSNTIEIALLPSC